MTETCVIATRGSQLALWQANTVAGTLERAFPNLDVQVKVIKTTGDVTLDMPLHEIGDKGMFTKELEVALLDGSADMCVHSMKDVPSELPENCVIAAMLERADVRDVLVCGPRIQGATSLADLPEGSVIGTGSLRRAAQLSASFPNVEPKGIRGNVDTRLEKSQGSDYDGVILAAAGVGRLGRSEMVSCVIPVEEMIPAAGQGAVGIEVRADDDRANAWCAAINDASTFECVAAERHILAELGGSCKVPLGAYARVVDDVAVIDAIVLSVDGGRVARSHVEAQMPADLIGLADRALAELEKQDARGILAEILAAEQE